MRQASKETTTQEPYIRVPEAHEQIGRGLAPVGNLDASVLAAQAADSPKLKALHRLVGRLLLKRQGTALDPLAIVSPERGEGRSFIAANLAVIFAKAGMRTLLIDADFRHPNQHELLGVRSGPGLSELLLGQSGPDLVVPVVGVPGLFLMPTGQVPDNPLELFASDLFAEVFAKLVDVCDVVIVDTPAGNGYMDAHAVTSQVGNALLVVEGNVTPVSAARQYADALDELGVNVAGAVINRS